MSVRKRIGLMVPSTNTTCEADFGMVVPRGMTVHGQRLWLTNDANGDPRILLFARVQVSNPKLHRLRGPGVEPQRQRDRAATRHPQHGPRR